MQTLVDQIFEIGCTCFLSVAFIHIFLKIMNVLI